MEEIGACTAVINKVQTTIDGGFRITLDLESSATFIATQLLEKKLQGQELLEVGFISKEDYE